MHLHALSGQTRRTTDCLGTGDHFPGNLSPPRGQVISHFKFNGGILNAPDFSDELGEQAGPAARLTAKDHLQRFALTLVRALVDKDAQRYLCAGPDVTSKTTQPQYVKTCEWNSAVAAFADMPGENTIAVTIGRWLGKVAGTRNSAFTSVEPIPLDTPLRNIGHGALQPSLMIPPDRWGDHPNTMAGGLGNRMRSQNARTEREVMMITPHAIAARPIALTNHSPLGTNFSSAITTATATMTVRFITPSTSWISISAQQHAAQSDPW